MANTISNAQIQTFERNVRYLAQQRYSRLRPYVQWRGEQSKNHNWDRVGAAVSATTKTSRAQATPINDTAWSRRQVAVTTKQLGDLVEPEDPVQMIVDPTSTISKSLSMGMGRAIDDLIIAAVTGTSLDGTGTPVVFPVTGGLYSSGQLVDSSGTTMTLDQVAKVASLFASNDIDPDVPKVMVIGPGQMRSLLNLVPATSRDYVEVKALSTNGFVKNWMGFDWIVSTRLGVTSGVTSCFAMTAAAMGFNMPKDVWARVAEDPSRSFAQVVYTAFTGGCVRVEDEQVVWFKVLNPTSAAV